MRLALIDADPLVYGSGFASDASAKRKWLERHGSIEGFDIKEHHEPLEFCLQMTKQKLNGVVERCEADDYLLYLSHPVNKREEFFPEYKANRDVTHKPFWHVEIGDYLLERHKAQFSQEGDEADDALGIHQMALLSAEEGVEPIIATIDKDLDMIPGLHYNWSPTKEANGIYEMEDPECLRVFYTQMLTGDSTDNIPGVFKQLGIKATAQLKTPLETMTNVREMYDYVLGVYKGDREFLDVIGKLLWIKRSHHWWEAPTSI